MPHAAGDKLFRTFETLEFANRCMGVVIRSEQFLDKPQITPAQDLLEEAAGYDLAICGHVLTPFSKTICFDLASRIVNMARKVMPETGYSSVVFFKNVRCESVFSHIGWDF
jgi:hypothetical protein